ncbi:retrovirus-related pol polyprotein from transposon TNT 1-94 [Tanacetum coccineum]
MQAQEQEELSIEEKATLFQQLLEKRRKHFAAKRAEEKRNKPPTKAQQRKIMCTYLKNMEGYKLKDLKLKEFDSIQEMFDRAFKRVNTFEDFRTELVEGKEKRAGTELVQEITKKQKVEDDKETTKLKQLMKIIPDEEEVAIDVIPLAVKSPSIVGWKIHKEGRKSYYQIMRADGKSQMYMIFSQMLKSFDREDLEDLYKLVKAKYESTRPVEDLDLLLWGDLKTMFEPHVEDKGLGFTEYKASTSGVETGKLGQENGKMPSVELAVPVPSAREPASAVVGNWAPTENLSSVEPKNVKEAIQDESWIMAMQEELNQFVTNDVWILVPPPKNQTFEMSMMGELNFFLGLQIKQLDDDIFFNQSKYIKEMLKKFGLEDSKPIKTLMSSETKITLDEDGESVDNTKCRDMIGILFGLTFEYFENNSTTIDSPPLAPSQPFKDNSSSAINLEPVELIFSTPPSSPHLFFDSLEDLPHRTTSPPPPQPTFESIERLAKQPPPLPRVMEPPLPPFPPQLLLNSQPM